MKYKNFHVDKPEINQLIYWLDPQIKETLGFYLGSTIFIEADGTQRGYYAKYWRPANETDQLLVTWSPEKLDLPQKRKYTKKPKSEQ